ncbi:unnamed protein product [Paramecium sonneborni]|uniref:Ion transport domain-containing protein n=1 Tax=Paramecium sonneborni TaxID=65129 RepID=A0A8S1NUC3_9CILI|nr:unnamed protein product [Paramecium sonneborni]
MNLLHQPRNLKKRLTISKELAQRKQSIIQHIQSGTQLAKQDSCSKINKQEKQNRKSSIDSSLHSHSSFFVQKKNQKEKELEEYDEYQLNSSEYSEQSILTIQFVNLEQKKTSKQFIEILNDKNHQFKADFDEEISEIKNHEKLSKYAELFALEQDDHFENEGAYEKIVKRYEKYYQRNPFQDPFYIQLVPLKGINRLFYELKKYQDNIKFLKFRKLVVFLSLIFPILANDMMNSRIYKILMTILILFNVSLFIVVKTEHREDTFEIEQAVTILFIIEIIVRILVSGIFFTKNAFFLRMQDIYDFTLIFATTINLYYPEIFIIDISPLRMITLLFYLGDIFHDLQVMLKALKQSIKFLIEALMIVGLFSLFFAICGVFLFQGLFNYRCVFENGDEVDGWIQCHQNQCYEDGMICKFTNETPKMPTSFNNVIFSYGQILRTITMDDWSWVMFFTMRIFHPWIWIYYLLIIFVGGFFGFNLVIAVLKTHYAEAAEESSKKQEEAEINKLIKDNQEHPERELINVFDVAFLRYIGFFSTIQKYRECFESKILMTQHLESESQMNKNIQEARTLSAAQKKLSGQYSLENQSLFTKIQQFTLKNILLRKFRLLKFQQLKINIKHYSEDPLELEILQKLLSTSYSCLQSQVNYQLEQNYSSQNDILLKFIQIDLALQEEKKFNPEKLRKIKFKHQYPNWSNQIKQIKKQAQQQKQLQRSYFPLKKRQPKWNIQFKQEEKEQEETSKNSYDMPEKSPEQKNQNQNLNLNLQKKVSQKRKSKKFAKIVDGQALIYVQGYYINYDEIKDKINLKIPIIKNHFTSNQFKYRKLREKELQSGKIITKSNWSGKDILVLNTKNLEYFNLIFAQLNQRDILIWMKGLKGKIQNFTKYANIIITSSISRVCFDLVIFINFTFLSLWNIADSNTIHQIENVSTVLLSIELFLRVTSIKIKDFTSNPNYVFQAAIVILNIIELTIKDLLNDFGEQNLRLIRGTKCLLFYRCLKYNAMAVRIGHIASMTFKQYIYLTFLMFLVIFMYALVGMEMFAGEFDQTDTLGQLHSYDNIFKAFMTIFNIMTNDDWYGVYVMGSELNYTFAVIYSYSMVIILNYLTYGLFMAVLLDGFGKYLNQSTENAPLFNDQQHAEITQNSNEELEKQVQQTILSPIGSQTHIILENNQTKSKVDLITNFFKSIKQLNKELLNKTPKLYVGIECQSSLYIFGKENIIRIVCTKIATSIIYVYFMDLVLYASMVTFIMNTYYDYEDSSNKTCNIIQFIINVWMSIDILINVIAKGLFLDKGSYFISVWQILDIIYMISHFITFGTSDYSQILDFFLYFGYLRPMKLLFRISWLTQLRIALGYSLVDITNVLITMLSVWIMFGVYGIILYEGSFGFCDDKMNFEINFDQCIKEDRHWINYKHNFDNITVAIPTLFVTSTLDGWGEIYQVAENSQLSNIGPQAFNSYIYTYFFFIIFVFIGSMFFLSLFTGVLYSNLKENQQKIEMTDVTQSQKEFQEISSIIIKDFPIFSSPPTNGIRKFASDITNNSYLLIFMYLMLILDLIILLLFESDMSEDYFRAVNNVHNALTVLYVVWIILLFLALGVGRFFDNYWRKFYFVLILVSIVDFIADYSMDWIMIYYRSTPYDKGYQILRIFFSLRSLRVILIFQGLINLQRLMRVMVFALPFLGKIFTILMIAMLIFALIGCQLYGQIDSGAVMDDQINFQNVAQALLALFKCASGDDWRTIMTDTMQHNPLCLHDPKYCGSVNNQYFFFLFMLLSNYVLLNLFVLGLIEQFEQFFQLQNSLIQTYVENVDKIKTVWCKYSSETQGQAMNYKFLCKFLLDIGKPLGGGKEENLWDVAKLASSFKLQCDHYGFIQYNQLMYELFRRCFVNEVFKEGSESSILKIKQFNKEMQLRLMYYRKNRLLERSNISPNKQLKANFNILHDYLTVLILFKTWESYSKLIFQKICREGNFSDSDEISIHNDKKSKQNFNNFEFDDDISESDNMTQKQMINQFSQQFNNSLNLNSIMQHSSSIQSAPKNHMIGSIKQTSQRKVQSFRNKKKGNQKININEQLQEPQNNNQELKHYNSLKSQSQIDQEEKLPYYKNQFDLSLQSDYREGTLLNVRKKY